MRIMHLIDSLEFGGAEQVVVSLSNIQSEDNDVVVCCVKTRGELADLLNNRVEVINLNKGEGNHYGLIFNISRILKNNNIDVLHVHNWGLFIAGALSTKISRLIVSVFTVHGTYLEYSPGLITSIKKYIRYKVGALLSGIYTNIVPVSEQLKDYIDEELNLYGDKIKVVVNGIEIGRKQATRKRNGKLILISVGRFHPVKNYPMMIRAIARVYSNNKEIELWLVGDGGIKGSLEELTSELEAESYIKLLGFRKDISKLLEKSDIFLMSSEYEGISVALLEAMRMGLPTVATRVGGIPETIKEGVTGLLVDHNDENAFVKSVEKMIDDQEQRIAMGDAARQRLEKYFSIETMVRNYNELYQVKSK